MIRRMVILSILLITGSFYLALASKSEPVPILLPLSEMPTHIGEWTETRSTLYDTETLEVLGVDDYINRVYINSEGSYLGLYIGYYQSQQAGDTIHSPMNCLPGSGWNPISKEYLKVPVQRQSTQHPGNAVRDKETAINRIIVEKGQDRNLVLYWYQSHGRIIASEYWGKIYAVLDAMRSSHTNAALIRVVSPIAGREAGIEKEAEKNAMSFIDSLLPLLDQHLPN